MATALKDEVSRMTLEEHMQWLYGPGSKAYPGNKMCTCEHMYASLGTLYGISMGKGWVRKNTDPACPHHGKKVV